MKKYDFLVVGAGLFGAVFAYEMTRRGKKCLVVEKRSHIGGNCYTEETEGINVHKYGAHIFHTSDKEIWEYVNGLVEFNKYSHSVIARWKNLCYNLPFNMNTFYHLWGTITPDDAAKVIDEQKLVLKGKTPTNLAEQAISLVGTDIYERLIKGYTEKQWGRKAEDLPAFIIKRIPVRFNFDNNYFNDPYQGIPVGGYTKIFEKLLEGIEVRLGVDYFELRNELDSLADATLFTGPIDAFYGYSHGHLEYRSVRFETEVLNQANFQGISVVNYTDAEIPYTRIIEHKHFEFGTQPKTVISKEFSTEWAPGDEPYYPVNDAKNTERFGKYQALADSETRYIFGGRLAEYKYYDMHHIVRSALTLVEKISNKP